MKREVVNFENRNMMCCLEIDKFIADAKLGAAEYLKAQISGYRAERKMKREKVNVENKTLSPLEIDSLIADAKLQAAEYLKAQISGYFASRKLRQTAI